MQPQPIPEHPREGGWQTTRTAFPVHDMLAVTDTDDSGSPRLAAPMLVSALVLGALGDWFLFRSGRPSLGALAFTAAVCAALALVTRHGRVRWCGAARRYAAAAAVFAACLAWRDSDALRALNALVAVFFAGIAAHETVGGSGRAWSVTGAVYAQVVAAANAAAGASRLLFREIDWKGSFGAGRTRHLAAAARGLLIAVPLLVVFGALFVSADAEFARRVRRLFDFDLDDIIRHGGFAAALAWVSGGLLRRLFHGAELVEPVAVSSTRPGNGAIEAAIALGSLNFLFLAFVAVQVPYLFGGEQYVAEAAGLTAAEYARRGFFELALVAALLLGVLLAADWLLPPGGGRARAVLAWLGVPLVALLMAVVASAMQRMAIYARSFGLTELRVYTSAFMLLVVAWFVWFVPTVLRGNRARFIIGAIWIGAAAALLLQAANPDGIIARANLSRAREGKPADLAYTATLSADAAPALAAGFAALPPQVNARMDNLRARWRSTAEQGWQSLNLSRIRAAALGADSRAQAPK
jgi:hypothetical protein